MGWPLCLVAGLIHGNTISAAETDYFLGLTSPESASAQRSIKRFPCHSCHGRDALGGKEGDVPAIDWATLSQTIPTRPAYDPESFLAAVTTGIGASGRELNRLMPRYDLSETETRALIAELSQVEIRERLGVMPDRVIFGVPDVIIDVVGTGFMDVLRRSVADTLGSATVFGRRIEFQSVNLDALDRSSNIFAVVAPPVHALDGLIAKAIPAFAPVGRLSGDEDRTIVRAITASRRQVLGAMAREIAGSGTSGYAIFADNAEDKGELALLIGLAGNIPEREDDKAVPDAVLLGAAELPRDIKPGRLWVEWHSLALRPLPEVPVTIVVIDAPELVRKAAVERIHPALVLAETAGRLAGEALKLAGRDLTRTRFLGSFEDVVSVEGLDYSEEPLTGTASVIFRRIGE